MFTIRPFEKSDAEYQAAVAVWNAVWPDLPETIQEWKHQDETRDPKYLFRRLVVEVEREIVATGIYCEPSWSYKPGKYFISVSVHPDFQRRGIGAAFYNRVMECLAERDPVTLVSNTRENKTDAVRFLTRRGFEQTMREPVSHLDVASFDLARFADIPARMEALGIKILSLAEIQTTDADWKRKFWDLDWDLSQDIPTTDPFTRPTFENFVEHVLGSPGFCPDANFIALDSGRWVGMSNLWTSQAKPDKLYTGLTGVARNHRRKKIATAMKLGAIDFAWRYGAKVIETDNEENNPMYDLNLKLGFQPQPAWLEFKKEKNSGSQEKTNP